MYTIDMTAPPPHTPRYDALLQLLKTADAILNASRAFFAPWDLSPSQFNVLNLLHGVPEGATQTDLGRDLIVHRSNITGLVDRLERRGLVLRKEVAEDRRVYRVVLTPAGVRLMDDVVPLYRQKAEELWGNCPKKSLSLLITQLRDAAKNADHIGRQFRRDAHEEPTNEGT